MGDTQGWQPIETAPKDGWFLAYHTENGKMIVSCGPRRKRFMDDDMRIWCCMNTNGESWAPTHWMPLPEPPK